MSTFVESASAKSQRTKVAIVALLLSIPLGGCGLWLLISPEGDLMLCSGGVMGLALSIGALLAGIFGFTNRPQLDIDDNGISVGGSPISSGNWVLSWDEISEAIIAGTTSAPTLQLTTIAQPPGRRFLAISKLEHFDDIIEIIRVRLEQLGRPVIDESRSIRATE